MPDEIPVPETGNPVWILPGHPPNTAPPYKYYPPVTDGEIGWIHITLVIFFREMPDAGDENPVTLASDVHGVYDFNGSPIDGGYIIDMKDKQSTTVRLKAKVTVPASKKPVSIPVTLSVKEKHGQMSKVIVELHSHPQAPTTVPIL